MSAKFYICRHCGNLVGMIHDAGVPMMCCGQKMEALEPNTVYVQTENGGQRKVLKPGDEPHVTFSLGDDKAVAVYAYCNLHGLWKTEI